MLFRSGSEIADDALFGVGIPRAENGEIFRVIGIEVDHPDDGADADGVGFGIGKIGTAGAHELSLQFVFAAHEEFLHFLGGLVFVVFAEVAVAAGDGDFLGVGGDFFLDEFGIFVLPAFEAFPRDDEIAFLLRLLTGDEGLDGRVTFHDAREQGALVHVVKAGGKLQGAREVLDDFEIGGANQLDEQILVVEDEIAEAIGAFFIELITFHGAEHGAKDLGAENIREGIGAFLGEPEEQFTAGGMLADEPGKGFLQQVDPAFMDEELRAFTAELGGDDIEGGADDVNPSVGMGVLEGIEGAAVFDGRHLVEQRAQLDVLGPDTLRSISLARRRRRPSRMSSRTKMASSATAGCVR